MDLHRLVSSLVMIGFEGHQPSPDTRCLLDQGVAGAILFKRNVVRAEQVAGLCASLKRQAARPFLLGVDQEGGRVARLRGSPFTAIPPMRHIGQLDDSQLAFDVGRLLGREIRAVGFDIDFAPVLDVDTNPQNPVIGDRSLSSDAHQVARLGVALARGLESVGVASCGKHFPGHGDTYQDSHLTLPRLPHSLERMRQVELVPFAAFAQASLAAMMTAHVVFEKLDADLPATFSKKLQTDLLRHELKFSGVVIADDLEMNAIAQHYPLDEAAVRAVGAGVDLLLVCHRPDRQQLVIDGLLREATSSPAFRERVIEAANRVDALVKRFGAPACPSANALATLDSAEHRALAARIMNMHSTPGQGFDPTEA